MYTQVTAVDLQLYSTYSYSIVLEYCSTARYTPTAHWGYDHVRFSLQVKSVRVDSCSVYSCVDTLCVHYVRGLLTRASNKLLAPKTFEKNVY